MFRLAMRGCAEMFVDLVTHEVINLEKKKLACTSKGEAGMFTHMFPVELMEWSEGKWSQRCSHM